MRPLRPYPSGLLPCRRANVQDVSEVQFAASTLLPTTKNASLRFISQPLLHCQLKSHLRSSRVTSSPHESCWCSEHPRGKAKRRAAELPVSQAGREALLIHVFTPPFTHASDSNGRDTELHSGLQVHHRSSNHSIDRFISDSCSATQIALCLVERKSFCGGR